MKIRINRRIFWSDEKFSLTIYLYLNSDSGDELVTHTVVGQKATGQKVTHFVKFLEILKNMNFYLMTDMNEFALGTRSWGSVLGSTFTSGPGSWTRVLIHVPNRVLDSVSNSWPPNRFHQYRSFIIEYNKYNSYFIEYPFGIFELSQHYVSITVILGNHNGHFVQK